MGHKHSKPEQCTRNKITKGFPCRRSKKKSGEGNQSLLARLSPAKEQSTPPAEEPKPFTGKQPTPPPAEEPKLPAEEPKPEPPPQPHPQPAQREGYMNEPPPPRCDQGDYYNRSEPCYTYDPPANFTVPYQAEPWYNDSNENNHFPHQVYRDQQMTEEAERFTNDLVDSIFGFDYKDYYQRLSLANNR